MKPLATHLLSPGRPAAPSSSRRPVQPSGTQSLARRAAIAALIVLLIVLLVVFAGQDETFVVAVGR